MRHLFTTSINAPPASRDLSASGPFAPQKWANTPHRLTKKIMNNSLLCGHREKSRMRCCVTHGMCRLSELAGASRLSLVYGSPPPPRPPSGQDTARRPRDSGIRSYADSRRRMSPRNKSRSVACCRSLIAACSPPPVSWLTNVHVTSLYLSQI